jgi:hypothetical protein
MTVLEADEQAVLDYVTEIAREVHAFFAAVTAEVERLRAQQQRGFGFDDPLAGVIRKLSC